MTAKSLQTAICLLFVAYLCFGQSNTQLNKAEELLKAGNYQQATREFNEIITSNSSSTEVNQAYLGIIKAYMAQGNYPEVLKSSSAALNYIEETEQQKSVSQVEFLDFKAQGFLNMGAMDSASFYADQSIATGESILSENLSEADLNKIGSPFTLIAQIKYYLGDYKGSSQKLEQLLGYYNQYAPENSSIAKQPYMLLGIVYLGMGEIDEAFESYQRALIIEKSQKQPDLDFLGTLHINISGAYAYVYDARQSLNSLLKAIDYYIQLPELRNEMADLYSSAAFTYSEMKKYDSADYYLSKTYEYFEKYPTYLYNQSAIKSKIASTLLNIGQLEKSLQYSNEGLALKRKIYGGNTTVAIYDYIRISEIAQKQSNFELAETYLDSARQLVSDPSGKIRDPYLEIDINRENMNLLHNQKESIDSLYKFISRTHQDISAKRKKLTGEISKTTKANTFYISAIDICYDEYIKSSNQRWAELALLMSESNKSLLLMDFIAETEKSNTAGVDQTILDNRDSLKAIASRLESDIEELTNLDSLKTDLLAKIDSLDEVQKQDNSILDKLKEENPSFFAYKYSNDELNLDKIQSILESEDRSIVSYSINNGKLYIFSVTADELKIAMKEWDLSDDILDLRNKMISLEDETGLEDITARLHSTLIAPIASSMTTSNITIIPDGVLNYLPFDLLRANSEDNYLISKHSISYDYSLKLFEHFRSLESNADNSQLLAFAPKFSESVAPINSELSSTINSDLRSMVLPLPGAQEEVNQISEIFEGNTFVGEEATETKFKEEADEFGVIHLATHAIVNDYSPSKSKLVFQQEGNSEDDGYLHAHEIFNLKLNADLVTLSACNTAFGSIKRGEGVMSLSRAFAYAGSPNCLVSLWPSSDKASPEIMSAFYENLAEGQSKDEALRNSKLAYLESASGKAAHPFYWSGFVFIGQPTPIDTGIPWIWVLVGGMMFISFVYFAAIKVKVA